MGFNTTVVVLNDALDDIEQDPNFGKNLAKAILKCGSTSKQVYVPAMNHGNAATVIESHHADYNFLIKVGGNQGKVVTELMGGESVNNQIRILKNEIKILEKKCKTKDEKIEELEFMISTKSM